MNIVFSILCSILYTLVGALLAIPYCFLAGWDPGNFIAVALVAPVFLLIWFMAAIFAGIIEPDHRGATNFKWKAVLHKGDHRMFSAALPIFWMWTIYISLPIILHWSAMLLENIGYDTVSSLVDAHRYASPSYVFVATVMLIILIGVVASIWEIAKNGWK